ncbi:hypothetical protein ZIOFF_056960 [Zingiber officinale]|uniref:Cytochrome b5 heme-binding domain-containing protein n=1 Tax=Zingiber officinale TaxID=94328 RepID=A0A8J5FYT1_ZINOF|nr:hypothetical protein ZIOFF_056960 [Zingiber officinale]
MRQLVRIPDFARHSKIQRSKGFVVMAAAEESTQWQMPQITKTGPDAELGLGHEAASLFLLESLKAYSPSEISLHASQKDCWLSIHGKVYDVTGFMGEHPGGEEALLQAAAGGDASQAFEEVGHSSTATAMMKDLLIGTVEGYSSGPPKPFFGTILPQQEAKTDSSSGVSAFLLPLLALAVAVAAWYYFNFLA